MNLFPYVVNAGLAALLQNNQIQVYPLYCPNVLTYLHGSRNIRHAHEII